MQSDKPLATLAVCRWCGALHLWYSIHTSVFSSSRKPEISIWYMQ